MIESLAKTVIEVKNKAFSSLEPSFFNGLKPDTVKNFQEADKPLRSEGVTTNIKSRNEHLEGSTHPETGVPFERKEVEVNGETVEVVAPEFDSAFDAQLPDDLYEASDRVQEKECNRQLKEEIEENPEIKEKFTDEQLEQINNGDTPDGYTWHHDVEEGKMQLVDSETHAKTGHTGGRSVWGGGSDNR